MTSPASVIVFALPGDVLGPALCGCDSNPKDRRPRSTPQLSQRDIDTRTSTDASAAAKKLYQPHKPRHPNQHDKLTSLIRRTRRLTDIKPSKLCRMTSDPSNYLAWISDTSMGTPTSSLCPRRPPHILSDLNVLRATFPHPITEARESGWREQMESLAEGLGSVVLQQIGRFMEATSQTQGMSAHPTGDRSHSWASTASHCRKDETGVPLGPSQIDENMGTRASLRYGTMEPMLKTTSDTRNSCTIVSNDSLSQKVLPPLGGVYTDTSHEDASKSWLWLRLPLEIWKGVLQLNVAALLLHGIIHEQLSSTHDPSVDQNTWLEKEENSNPRLSRGGESRTVGKTPSHNGQSSTAVKRRIASRGGVDSDGDNDDNDGDDDNDDKDGDRGNEQVVSKRRRSEANSKRLACPYLKYNPRKYESEKSCMGPGWATVHRVKEHIYRRHRLPLQCNRCQETFNDTAGLAKHERQAKPCVRVQKTGAADGINREQESILRSRRKRSATEEEKWREMYAIIFPEEEIIPNPYCTHEDSVSAIPNGSTTLKQHIQNAVSDVISNVTEFDQLDLVHMQQVINSAVQDGFHTFRERGSYGYAPTTTDAQRQQTQPVIDKNDLMSNTQDFALVNSTECGRSSPEIGIGKRKENDPRGQTNNSNNEYVDGTHNESKEEHDVWPPRHIEEERQPNKLWACPFYKLDPHRHYQCLKYKLKRFADLRQHIARVHVVKDYYCRDCWAHFKREDNLDSHIRNGDCRGVKEREKITTDDPILHGLFPEEVTPLHVISRHGNETDKWYRMWDTLFREHLRPASPFVMEGIAEPMALLAHHGETELQAQLPALLQRCNQRDQQSVWRLGQEITRIFCNSSPHVSRPSFRKLPNQDADKGTVGAGDDWADSIKVSSSIADDLFAHIFESDLAFPLYFDDSLRERSFFQSTGDDDNAIVRPSEFSGDLGYFRTDFPDDSRLVPFQDTYKPPDLPEDI